MIPNSKELLRDAKYLLLEKADFIRADDEYYNPIQDRWLPIESEFINVEFDPDESKPVRRKK